MIMSLIRLIIGVLAIIFLVTKVFGAELEIPTTNSSFKGSSIPISELKRVSQDGKILQNSKNIELKKNTSSSAGNIRSVTFSNSSNNDDSNNSDNNEELLSQNNTSQKNNQDENIPTNPKYVGSSIDSEEDFMSFIEGKIGKLADEMGNRFSSFDKALSKELDQAEIEEFGILTPTSGGFSEDLWQGLSRERAVKFLTNIRMQGISSFTGRELLSSALLSKATPPQDNKKSDNNWLAERIETLYSLGMSESANTLLSGAGINSQRINSYEGINKVWAQNSLLAGNTQEICDYTSNQILNSDELFWRKILLVCQTLKNDKAGVELSMSLIKEKEKKNDWFFFALLEAVQQSSGDIKSPRLPPDEKFSQLHSVLYMHSPKLVTPDVILRLPDNVLRRIMNDEKLEESLRIQASEKLVSDFQYESDANKLVELYNNVEFKDEVLQSASIIQYSESEIIDGSISRALLWQGTKLSKEKSTAALTLKALWQRAEQDGLLNLPAQLSPDKQGLEADSSLAWFAPYVISTNLRSGNYPIAQKWWKSLLENRNLSRDLKANQLSLAIPFSFVTGEIDKNKLNAWWKGQSITDSQQIKQVEKLLSLLEASNINIPSQIWIELHGKSDNNFEDRGASSLWLKVLGTSLEVNNTGEAIFFMLEPLLESYVADLSSQNIANIVTGLNFLNLPDYANGIALETILDRGIR